MHELYITRSIYQIVLKHAQKRKVNRVLSVTLEIGALSDLEGEWIQRFFDRLSAGSIVDGAKLKIIRVPAVFQCNQCRHTFEIESLWEEELACKHCTSKDVILVSGNEYRIKNMEAV